MQIWQKYPHHTKLTNMTTAAGKNACFRLRYHSCSNERTPVPITYHLTSAVWMV